MYIYICILIYIYISWLVVGLNPSEKYDFVNWDDDYKPNMNGKMYKNGNQTTNQYGL